MDTLNIVAHRAMALHMFNLTHPLLSTITQICPPTQIYLPPRLVLFFEYYYQASYASVSSRAISATVVCQYEVGGSSLLHKSQGNNLPEVTQIDTHGSAFNDVCGTQINASIDHRVFVDRRVFIIQRVT